MNPLEQLRLVNDAIARHKDHVTAEELRHTANVERQALQAKIDAAKVHEAMNTEPVVDEVTLARIREAGNLPLAVRQPEPEPEPGESLFWRSR